MQASSDVAVVKDAADSNGFDFDAVFADEYGRVVRVIARVIRDPGRAEELAVDTFWRLWNTSSAHGPAASGWLRRTAAHLAIDEFGGAPGVTGTTGSSALLVRRGGQTNYS